MFVDDRNNLMTKTEKDNDVSEMNLGVVSNNRVMHNLAKYERLDICNKNVGPAQIYRVDQ